MSSSKDYVWGIRAPDELGAYMIEEVAREPHRLTRSVKFGQLLMAVRHIGFKKETEYITQGQVVAHRILVDRIIGVLATEMDGKAGIAGDLYTELNELEVFLEDKIPFDVLEEARLMVEPKQKGLTRVSPRPR